MLRAVAITCALALLLATLVAVFWSRVPEPPISNTSGAPLERSREGEAPRVAEEAAVSDVGAVTREEFGDDVGAAAPAPAAVASPLQVLQILQVRVIDPLTKEPWPAIPVELSELRPLGGALAGTESNERLVGLATQSQRANSAGIATFADVPVGKYRLTTTGLSAHSRPLTFEKSAEAEQWIELEAWRAADVSGVVVDLNGIAVQNATISAQVRGDVDGKTTRAYSDAKGRFSMLGIDVRESGNRGFVTATFRATSDSFLDAAELESSIRAGDNELSRPLVLQRRATSIQGRMLKGHGQPAQRSAVMCQALEAKSSAPMTGQTDFEGRFRFDGLAPGKYLLSCPVTCYQSTQPIEAGLGAVVDVGDLVGSTSRFEFRGTVMFEDGRPAAGVLVISGNGGDAIDGSGEFSFFDCSDAPRDLSFQWRESADGYVFWKQVERNVVPGTEPLRVTLIVRGVVLQLTDSDTELPLDAASLEISLLDSQGQAATQRYARTSGNHRLELAGFEPGKVTLQVRAAGYRMVERSIDLPRGGFTRRETIDVALTRVE